MEHISELVTLKEWPALCEQFQKQHRKDELWLQGQVYCHGWRIGKVLEMQQNYARCQDQNGNVFVLWACHAAKAVRPT